MTAPDPHAFTEEHLTAQAIRCLFAVQRALALDDHTIAAPYVTPPFLTAFRRARAGRRSILVGVPELDPDVVVVAIDELAGRALLHVRHDGGVDVFSGESLAGQREQWTMRRLDDRWRLAAVDPLPAGAPRGSASDATARAAAFELARADAVDDGALDADLVADARDNPRHALAELSSLDGRFAWHVLEHVVAQVADAWRDAAELGTREPLHAIASEEAARALLASGPPRPLAPIAPLAVHAGRVLLVVDAADRQDRWRLDADASRPGGWRLSRLRVGQ